MFLAATACGAYGNLLACFLVSHCALANQKRRARQWVTAARLHSSIIKGCQNIARIDTTNVEQCCQPPHAQRFKNRAVRQAV